MRLTGYGRGRFVLFAAALCAVAGAVIGAALAGDTAAAREPGSTPPAVQTVSPARGPAAEVRIEALGTELHGITGNPRTAMRDVRAVGESATWFVDLQGEEGADMCLPHVWTAPNDGAVVIWKFDVKVIGIAGSRTTLQIHWIRSRAGRQEREQERTITLAPDDMHVLDYLENPNESGPCANLVLRVLAQPVSETAPETIAVDLWTVDEAASPGVPPAHRRLAGVTGQLLKFQLPPLNIVATGDAGRAVRVEVSGTVYAVVTPDGFIDIDLTAKRRTFLGRGWGGGEGQIRFRTKPGETASVLLPDPGDRDLVEALAGHRFSLYVKVQAARQ